MVLIGLIRLFFVIVGVIVGLLFFGLGIYQTQVNPDLQALLIDANVSNSQFLLIIIGILIVVASLMNLVRAIRASTTSTIIHVFVISMITVVVVIMAVLIFTSRDKFLKQTGKVYDKTWDRRKEASASRILNSINQYLRCCGRDNFTDYIPNVPPSCCDEPVINVCPATGVYLRGCRSELNKFLNLKIDSVGFSAIVVGLVFVLMAVFRIYEYIIGY